MLASESHAHKSRNTSKKAYKFELELLRPFSSPKLLSPVLGKEYFFFRKDSRIKLAPKSKAAATSSKENKLASKASAKPKAGVATHKAVMATTTTKAPSLKNTTTATKPEAAIVKKPAVTKTVAGKPKPKTTATTQTTTTASKGVAAKKGVTGTTGVFEGKDRRACKEGCGCKNGNC